MLQVASVHFAASPGFRYGAVDANRSALTAVSFSRRIAHDPEIITDQ